MNWDNLPGDSANQITDAYNELDMLDGYLRDGDGPEDLSGVSDYVKNAIDYLTDAYEAIERALRNG